MGENAVRHVEPAIGAPAEAVHELVRVLATETGEHDTPRVGFVVAIGIAEVDQMRLLADVDSVVAAKDGGGEIEAFDEDSALVGLAVVVGVFEDDDAVAGKVLGSWFFVLGWEAVRGDGVVLIVLRLVAEGRGVRGAVRVFVSLHDPQTAAMIPGHGDGILHHRLMREAADLVALRHGHFRAGLLWCGTCIV